MQQPESLRPARAARAARVRAWAALIVGGVLALGGSTAVAAAFTGPTVSQGEPLGTQVVSSGEATPAPSSGPIPDRTPVAGAEEPGSESTDSSGDASDRGSATPSPRALCDDPAVTAALGAGIGAAADAAVIAAVGGADAFRAAVAHGTAPCLDLSAANRVWVVVNKQRALNPIDYAPEPLAYVEGMRRTSGNQLRADAADAAGQLAAAAEAEGAGAVGMNSGFRSYAVQQSTYAGHVGSLGRDAADLVSARPGHSEHQTGLAVDLVACPRGCGTLEQLAGTPQAAWLAANAWRFGFIVRYEDGMTGITGYAWEPWHLRYIGLDLAKAYHDGGYHTLEEFFGLPPAPGYLD